MSTLNPAANPAQSPRADGAKTTEYVCTNPDGVCDLNCCKCPYFVPESETVSMEQSQPDWMPIIEYLICEDCEHVQKLPEGIEIENISPDANCERCSGRVWGLTAGEFALSKMFGNLDEQAAANGSEELFMTCENRYGTCESDRCRCFPGYFPESGFDGEPEQEFVFYFVNCPRCGKQSDITDPNFHPDSGFRCACGLMQSNDDIIPYGKFVPDWIQSHPEYDALVTEVLALVEPAVTKEPCISPPQFVDVAFCQQEINHPYQTMHHFRTWDDVDREITRLVNDFRIYKLWDIFAWRFVGSAHWFDELCHIPQNMWIEVRWGCINA